MTERHGSLLTRHLRWLRGAGAAAGYPAPAAVRVGPAVGSTEQPKSCVAQGRTRTAELGEWRVVWRRDRNRVRIVRLRNTVEDRTVLAVTDPDTAPDLAEMRERFPELGALWDAVRHQFWAYALREIGG